MAAEVPVRRKRKLLSLGTYPDTSLKLARCKRDDARTLLAKNIDPSTRRREEKSALTNTLSAVADEWFKAGSPGGKNKQLKPVTIVQLHHRYDKYLKPRLGKMPVASIAVHDLRSVLLKIQDAGKRETAHRVRALAERIFRFAIATGRADRNIAADLEPISITAAPCWIIGMPFNRRLDLAMNRLPMKSVCQAGDSD